MGLFGKKDSGNFVSENQYNQNKSTQAAASKEILSQLRQYGVGVKDNKELEFFFYTNSEDKAKALAGALHEMGYKAVFDARSKKEFVITGWSTKIRMDNETVSKWTLEMVDLGYKYDCDFDGWGTPID